MRWWMGVGGPYGLGSLECVLVSNTRTSRIETRLGQQTTNRIVSTLGCGFGLLHLRRDMPGVGIVRLLLSFPFGFFLPSRLLTHKSLLF